MERFDLNISESIYSTISKFNDTFCDLLMANINNSLKENGMPIIERMHIDGFDIKTHKSAKLKIMAVVRSPLSNNCVPILITYKEDKNGASYKANMHMLGTCVEEYIPSIDARSYQDIL